MLATCNIINVIRLKEGKIIAFLLSKFNRQMIISKIEKLPVISAKCAGTLKIPKFLIRKTAKVARNKNSKSLYARPSVKFQLKI